MRLRRAATFFDNTPCVDAYTGVFAFNGQFSLYDDTKRDAEVAERRVVSVAPLTVLPVRRVIAAQNAHYILGHGTPDQFRGRTIRIGYVAHEATFLGDIQTLGQACTDTIGTQAWAAVYKTKGLAFSEHSSALPDQTHIHVSSTETVPVASFVTLGSQHYLVRSTEEGPAGTLILVADELPLAIHENASVVDGTYDPITDSVVGTTSTFRVLRIRWQSLFEYGTAIARPFAPGEVQFAMAKSQHTPKVGARITLPDGTWQVLAINDVADAWICRAAQHV